MKHWLFNCKEVSQLVSETMDKDTSLFRRVGIKFHLMMCRYCARYERQLHSLRQAIRSSTADNDERLPRTMSDRKKRKIQTILNSNQEKD